MEKGAAGEDSARAVGICDRLLTFLTNNLSMNRQKNMAEGPRNGGSSDHNTHAEVEKKEDDECAVQIEKVDFEFSKEEEDHKASVIATVLGERNADAVNTARASEDRPKEAMAEAGGHHEVAAEPVAVVPAQEGKKMRKSVTINEEAVDKVKDLAKKSLFKKKQASSAGQLGAGEEEPKPAPRYGLRPRMPSIRRIPTNINEKSSTFIEERKRGFGGGAGKQAK